MALSLRVVHGTTHHEAIDWARRVVANGGSVSTTTVRAVSDFCATIDRAGLRSKFTRWNWFCGQQLEAALVPLYRASSFGGATVGNSTDTNTNFVGADYTERGASGGLVGNGSTKHLATGVPGNWTSAASAHMGVGLRTTESASGTFKALIGAYNNASNAIEIDTRRGSGFGVRACAWTRFSTASDGFGDNVNTADLAVGDLFASWPTFFRDATASGVTATTSQDYPTTTGIYVFALNNAGTAINHTACRLDWYSIGAVMTASEVATVDAAVKAFRRAMGRL